MLDLVLDAMESLPEAAFLDVGANIGVYTVAVAALRPAREVTGVDSRSCRWSLWRPTPPTSPMSRRVCTSTRLVGELGFSTTPSGFFQRSIALIQTQ